MNQANNGNQNGNQPDEANLNQLQQFECHGFHTEENGTHFCTQHDCYLCERCISEHAGHERCDSVINILTQEFNKWRNLIDLLDNIKQKFVKNIESYDKLIKVLKNENFNKPKLEPRELVFIYKNIKTTLDRHLANVVLFCKKRMVRDVINFMIDLAKVEQRLKELQQGVSLVNLVGQYLPPLPKIDKQCFLSTRQRADSNNFGETSGNKEGEQFGGCIDEMAFMEHHSEAMIEEAIFWSEQADM